MTEKERVLSALNHIQPDTVPYQLDLTDLVYQRLQGYFGDEGFFAKTGSHLAQERNESFEEISETEFRDMFGVLWSREQEGDFGIVRGRVLKDASLDGYAFPEPDDALIREKCGRLAAQQDKFTMYIVGFSLFERAWTLRGFNEILMDFLLEKRFANELLDKIVEYNLKVVDIAASYDIDCIFFGDDWGQQRGLIMGPHVFKEFILPRQKLMYDYVKSKGMYVAQHSCGDIREVFGSLVDAGMDIYNTFQPEIYDVSAMKREYGQSVTFYGGISTQRLLPFGSPDDVRRETKEMMDIVGRGGGYIAAPTHSIPNDVPTENILAFLDTVQGQRVF
ncbi:MAG: uroporphyrinogen decarboxylase [Clostridiales bacterium]|nr:uroporphyrinogen decarboxylase [Clostridiales bacterium]